MKSIAYLNNSRPLRVGAALALALILGSYIPWSPLVPPPPLERAELRFTPVVLDESAPARRRLGQLTFLEGWEIASPARRFGGISAMHVEDGRVVAVSDGGTVISFPLPRGSTGSGTIATLLHGPGPLAERTARDSESLLVLGEQAWIAFENRNAVWRYSTSDWTPQAAARPEAMSRWSANSGSEAITRLPDGRFLIMAEGTRDDGTSRALLFDGDPAVRGTSAMMFRHRPPTGFKVTDAAALPDGRLLLLTRRLSLPEGFTAKLTMLRLPERLEEGVIIEGVELAHFAAPVAADNFEALSVEQENGRTIVSIASDDNFSPLQRSLLLRFELRP